MKPICTEIRQLVIRAKEQGKKRKEIAYLYNISFITVKRIISLHKATGSIKPKVNKGRKSRLTETMIQAIKDKIENQPDVTLSAIIEDLQLPIGVTQLHRFLKKRGFSYKKNSIPTSATKKRCSCKT
jgi:transposase